MKERILLGINIVVLLSFVAATTLVANRWRLEGDNYLKKKKADGGIEHTRLVARAERDAKVTLSRYKAEGEKSRDVTITKARKHGEVIETLGETDRKRGNNEATVAMAEAVQEAQRRAADGASTYSGIQVPYHRPSNLPEGSSFEDLLKRQNSKGSQPEPSHFQDLLDEKPRKKDPNQLFKKKY